MVVDLDSEHTVEQEEEVVSLRTLLDEHLAFGELASFELAVAVEQIPRQLPLERGLRSRDDRRRLLVSPRRVVAVRLAVPRLEVDDAALPGENAFVVVDPMPRERARADELVLDAAVRVEGEAERRPRRRRVDAEPRPAFDRPGRREPCASADRLHEPGSVPRDLGLVAKHLERHARHHDRL